MNTKHGLPQTTYRFSTIFIIFKNNFYLVYNDFIKDLANLLKDSMVDQLSEDDIHKIDKIKDLINIDNISSAPVGADYASKIHAFLLEIKNDFILKNTSFSDDYNGMLLFKIKLLMNKLINLLDMKKDLNDNIYIMNFFIKTLDLKTQHKVFNDHFKLTYHIKTNDYIKKLLPNLTEYHLLDLDPNGRIIAITKVKRDSPSTTTTFGLSIENVLTMVNDTLKEDDILAIDMNIAPIGESAGAPAGTSVEFPPPNYVYLFNLSEAKYQKEYGYFDSLRSRAGSTPLKELDEIIENIDEKLNESSAPASLEPASLVPASLAPESFLDRLKKEYAAPDTFPPGIELGPGWEDQIIKQYNPLETRQKGGNPNNKYYIKYTNPKMSYRINYTQ